MLSHTDQVTGLHQASRDSCSLYAAPKFITAGTADDEPEIPSPSLFDFSETSSKGADEQMAPIPTVAQLAVHLELLEAILILRSKVIKSNKLDFVFDTMPIKQYSTRRVWRRNRCFNQRYILKPVEAHDPTYQARRREKWPRFFGYAYMRFRTWAFALGSWLEQNGYKNRNIRVMADLMPPLGTRSKITLDLTSLIVDRYIDGMA